MASVLSSPDKLTECRLGLQTTADGTRSAPAETPLFRFGLRQLFVFIALVSTVLAAMVLAGGITAVAVLLAVLVVAAHLFSTALASRLRSRTDAAREFAQTVSAATSSAESNPEHENSAVVPHSLNRSPWHARGSTSLPWLPRLIAAGTIVGGFLGATVFAITIGDRSSVAGIAVGGVSSAVLGGWFAFLGGSFYGIFRHGLREAVAEQKKDEIR